MNILNNVAALAQLGIETIIVKPKRAVGPFTADVTLRERHHDQLQVTTHPVEFGSTISDHAFLLPAELTIVCGWSNSPRARGVAGLASVVTGTVVAAQSLLSGNSAASVKDTYAKLLQLQAQRVPFDVYTGKRVYKNMLITVLDTETTGQTENSLVITVELKEIIMVSTSTVAVPAAAEAQANPSSTQAVSNLGGKSLQPGTAYRGGIRTLTDKLEALE